MSQRVELQRLVRYQYVESLLQGKRILEFGCGFGQGTAFLAARAAQVIAVDISPGSVINACERYKRPNITFEVTEPAQLDHPNESFDVALIPEMSRWKNNMEMISEIRRVLKPNGIAIFSVTTNSNNNAETLSLDELRERLAEEFVQIRTVGEIPFLGTTFAD
ncbi:MAG: class I SAM-dependent methyltransferase, partial [Pseudomonadota bacterium]